MKKLLFLLLLLPALAVHANRVAGLYQAEVDVPDQLAGNRQEAVRTAMRSVLIKITGDRFAPQQTSLQPVIEKAEDYLLQYRYIKVSKKADREGPEESIQLQEALKLRVKFDETTLNAALRNLGVPIWGKERPTTLVWLALQDKNGRRLLSLEQDPDYIRILDERARSRGIVLIFPLMDLEDSSNLSVSDIWGGFRGPLLQASGRYQADTILTGKIAPAAAGIWEAGWTSYIEDEVSRWSAEGVLPDVVLDEGVDGHADLLASRYVGSGSLTETARLAITVNDIVTADQYARVLEYLRSLSSVTGVQVEWVEDGQVRFAMTAHGGELAVRRAIALSRFMEPLPDGGGNSYRLRP